MMILCAILFLIVGGLMLLGGWLGVHDPVTTLAMVVAGAVFVVGGAICNGLAGIRDDLRTMLDARELEDAEEHDRARR